MTAVKKGSTVKCSPDTNKRGKVTVAFNVGSKQISVSHWIKKKADTITAISVAGKQQIVQYVFPWLDLLPVSGKC